MALHVGLGPVFAYEWLTTSRRWQYFAGRSLFVTVLLAVLIVVWWSEAGTIATLRLNHLAVVGELFFYAIVGTQLTLVLLVAPAVTAGDICVDKSRGTLLHLLATDLSNTEIILGKLATRLGIILGLVLCGLPVLFLGALEGGIDPEALTSAFLITLGVGLLGGSLALTLSVWCRKTFEVLLATYMIWTLLLVFNWAWKVLALNPLPMWAEAIDPFWLAFAPYCSPGATDLGDAGVFLVATMLLSAVLIALAAWRVRAVVLGQCDKPWKRLRTPRLLGLANIIRKLPGPSLDFNAVLWRDWHRKRTSRWVLAVWLVYGGLALGFSVLVIIRHSFGRSSGELGPFVNSFQVAIGLLLVSVASVTSLAEERERNS